MFNLITIFIMSSRSLGCLFNVKEEDEENCDENNDRNIHLNNRCITYHEQIDSKISHGVHFITYMASYLTVHDRKKRCLNYFMNCSSKRPLINNVYDNGVLFVPQIVFAIRNRINGKEYMKIYDIDFEINHRGEIIMNSTHKDSNNKKTCIILKNFALCGNISITNNMNITDNLDTVKNKIREMNNIKNTKDLETINKDIFDYIFVISGLLNIVPPILRCCENYDIIFKTKDEYYKNIKRLFRCEREDDFVTMLMLKPDIFYNIIMKANELSVDDQKLCVLMYVKFIIEHYRGLFGWTVPNVIQIEYILDVVGNGRIIELGAGIAQIAHILRSFNCDIIVTDKYYPAFNKWIKRTSDLHTTYEDIEDPYYASLNSRTILDKFGKGNKMNSLLLQLKPCTLKEDVFDFKIFSSKFEKLKQYKFKNKLVGDNLNDIEKEFNKFYDEVEIEVQNMLDHINEDENLVHNTSKYAIDAILWCSKNKIENIFVVGDLQDDLTDINDFLIVLNKNYTLFNSMHLNSLNNTCDMFFHYKII